MERALRSWDPPREAQLLAMVDVGGDLRAELEDLELRLRPYHRDLPCRGLGAGDTRRRPRLLIARRRVDERRAVASLRLDPEDAHDARPPMSRRAHRATRARRAIPTIPCS